ncbi:MAG: DUF29 domain-containing protein [Coleofasciculaceae cyanobacterium SM2_3_26]|nr:DUF29 domain-containing protein [Coleofasciculaceae cyanobacterium SM2_3_26]
MTLSTEYDRDFYNWILQNVALLRSGNLAQADIEHIADELESMGKRDLRQLRSRLQVLLMHLLKWKYQPDKQTKSWRATIDHQRDEIEALLLDSPSLRGHLHQMLDSVYPKAVRDAVRETGLAAGMFPQACPFELSEILEERFLPDTED